MPKAVVGYISAHWLDPTNRLDSPGFDCYSIKPSQSSLQAVADGSSRAIHTARLDRPVAFPSGFVRDHRSDSRETVKRE